MSTTLLFIVTAALALYAKCNLDALLATNRQSAQFYELDALPWLSVRLDIVRSKAAEDSMWVVLVVKNSGKSAATNMSSILRRYWERQGSVFIDSEYSSIPWRERSDDYVPASDSWHSQPVSLWPAGKEHTSQDTMYLHMCFFFTGALSGKRYYFERLAQVSNVERIRRGTGKGWQFDISYKDALVGVVRGDTVRRRWDPD